MLTAPWTIFQMALEIPTIVLDNTISVFSAGAKRVSCVIPCSNLTPKDIFTQDTIISASFPFSHLQYGL